MFSEKKNSSLNVVTLAYRKGASTAVPFRAWLITGVLKARDPHIPRETVDEDVESIW